jgi:hypothetical protein
MTQFINTMLTATRNGVSRTLRTHPEFQSCEIASGYMLQQWRNDSDVDLDERRFFKSLTTKSPFLIDVPAIEQDALLSEFKYNIPTALGLGYAYLLDSLAVSLPSEELWNSNTIEIEHCQIKPDESLSTEPVTVFHSSHPDHAKSHQKWITHRLASNILDGNDLWNRRGSLFPALSFCHSVEAQLQHLNSGSPLLIQVVKRLFEFENHCKDWEEGPFIADLLPSKASPESAATIQQFGAERTFLCPDGTKRIFSWHVRLTPGAWRLHFYPEAKDHTINIGYLGPHLSTVNDPT